MRTNSTQTFLNIRFWSVMAIVITCAAPLAAGEPKADKAQWLDVIRLKGSSETRPLALVQVQVMYPSEDAAEVLSHIRQIDKIFPKGTNNKSFTDPIGSRAFLLVRRRAGLSAQALQGDQVAGLVYGWAEIHLDRLKVFWSGCLVHSRPMDQTYAVLVRSRAFDVTIAVIPVDPEHNLGKFPLEFPSDKMASWPKPLQVVGEQMIKLDHACVIEEVYAVPDRKTLLIAAQPAHVKCEPYYYRFDLEKKTWETAKVVKGQPIK